MMTKKELKGIADFINTTAEWEATLIDSKDFSSWLDRTFSQEELNSQFTEAVIRAIRQGKPMPFTLG